MTASRIVGSIGVCLQFVGVLLVFVEISGTQRAVGREAWDQRLARAILRPVWAVARKFGWKPATQFLRPETLTANVDATATLRARLSIHVKQGASVEERLHVVEQRADELDRLVDELRTDLETSGRKLGERLEAQIAQVHQLASENANELRRLVTKVSLGSAPTKALGGILIMIGTIFTGVSLWL
jgi:hypothetical protein